MKNIRNDIQSLEDYLRKDEDSLRFRVFNFCSTLILCISFISILILLREMIK